MRIGPVKLLVLTRASWFFIPLSPVASLYFRSIGLSSGQSLFVFSVFLIINSLLDVPSSYIGEITSKKYALLISCIFKGIGGLLLVNHPSFERVISAYACIAVANGLFSGIDQALLLQQCAEDGQEIDQVRQIQTRAYITTVVVALISAAIGGFLGTVIGLGPIAYINAGTAWLPLILATLFFFESAGVETGDGAERTAKAAINVPLAEALSGSRYLVYMCLTVFLSTISFWLVSFYQVKIAWLLSIPAYLGLFSVFQTLYTVPLGVYLRRKNAAALPETLPLILTFILILAFIFIWGKQIFLVFAGIIILDCVRSYIASRVTFRLAVNTSHKRQATILSFVGSSSKLLSGCLVAASSARPSMFLPIYCFAAIVIGGCLQGLYSLTASRHLGRRR